MEFLDEKLDQYIVHHSEDEPPVLKELNRETWAKILQPRMLAGHYQGRVLSFLSKMIQPKNVLEIGTYTGYSAICWAEGLQSGGKIHTLEINEELEDMIRQFFSKAGVADKIDLHIGVATEIIPTLDIEFDLVYIDADKDNYSNYFDLAFDKVKTGGYIIADNVLWSGKVLDQPELLDEDTKALIEYSQKVKSDPRVENVLLPIRDGLMVARKL